MSSIVLNKLNNNIVASDIRCANNFKPIIKKRFYFRKTNGSRSKVKLKALFLLTHFKGYHAFITLTTQQSKSFFGMCLTDSELMQQVGILLRNKKFFGDYYICVCERQRDTNDLHFHILTYYKSKTFVDYKKLKEEVSYRFGAICHPALLQFDWLDNNTKGVARYISKLSSYVSKESSKDNAPYSSLFTCRTYSISNKLSKVWKSVANQYTCSVTTDFLVHYKHQLVENFVTPYFTIYKLSPYIWHVAQQYRLNVSRLAQSEEIRKFKKQIKQNESLLENNKRKYC